MILEDVMVPYSLDKDRNKVDPRAGVIPDRKSVV